MYLWQFDCCCDRKISPQHQTSTGLSGACGGNRVTPSPSPLLGALSHIHSKTACRGFKSFCPCQKWRGEHTLASLFFVSAHKDSATRHGCALRSACRGGLQPGGLRPGPAEAAAETSPSLDFLLAFRVFSSGFTRSQLFPSSPAPKTHPISPFWGFSGCVSLFLSSFDLQNFRLCFCASCRIAFTD